MWHFLGKVQAIPILLLFLKSCFRLSGRRCWERLSFSLMHRSLTQSFLKTFCSTSKNVCIYSPSPWFLTRLDSEHRWLPCVIIWTRAEASVCQLHFISYRRFLSASFRPQICSCWPSPGQNDHSRGLNQHPSPQTSPFGRQTKERGLVHLSVS